MKNLVVFSAVAVFLLSCNVYRPLTSASSDEDYKEEAQRCLHSGDYACALENYGKLSNETERNEKTCLANISRAGMTLNALLNVVTQSTSKMMGSLSNVVQPWTAEKSTAGAAAVTACDAYKTAVAADTSKKNNGVLLQTLARLGSCSVRMARAELFQGTSSSDTTCNTPNPASNGKVTSTDLTTDAGGAISAAKPGMCEADVVACRNEITGVDFSGLGAAGLNDLSNAVNLIPAPIKDSGAGVAAVRKSLGDTLDAN